MPISLKLKDYIDRKIELYEAIALKNHQYGGNFIITNDYIYRTLLIVSGYVSNSK